MDEHRIRHILEGGAGALGALVRAALWFPGKVYGGVMELRRFAYARGALASHWPALPTISVGNLTAGGSGKTPFTILLARLLADMGVGTVAILLRGYRQDASGFSDEAVLYRRHCPEAVIEVGADRVRSAEGARGAGAHVILLDDGFQHLRLRRHLDIVLVDATSPWGGGNTIPGGLLREPKRALGHAGAVVITRSDQCRPDFLDALKSEIAFLAPRAELFTARHLPYRLLRLDDGDMPPEALRGRRVVALSGIARPEAFERTLSDLGAEVVASVRARDHAEFTSELVQTALAKADALDAVVVITEKDRTKQIFTNLADNTRENEAHVLTLAVRQEVDDEERLADLLRKTLARVEKNPGNS